MHTREGDRYKDRGEKGGKLAMRNIGRRERERNGEEEEERKKSAALEREERDWWICKDRVCHYTACLRKRGMRRCKRVQRKMRKGWKCKGGKERSQWKKFSFVPMRGRRRENRREGREAMQ